MKNFLLYLLFFGIVFTSCKKGDTGPQGATGPAGPTGSTGNNNPAPLPIACFTVSDSTTANPTHVFSFTNCSQNAVRYEWDFDDATYAPVANPNHVFSHPGNFNVRMTAYNADNIGDQTSRVISVVSGHYGLTQIKYHQLYSILTMPVTVLFYNANFTVADTIAQGQLPYTSVLTGNSMYDYSGPSVSYNLRTIDTSGHNYNRAFPVAATSIINNQFDTLFTLGPDTTKFTLYFGYY